MKSFAKGKWNGDGSRGIKDERRDCEPRVPICTAESQPCRRAFARITIRSTSMESREGSLILRYPRSYFVFLLTSRFNKI